MSETYTQLLDRAALDWGVEPGFWDIWGRRHETGADTKRAILTALGVPCGDSFQIQTALDRRYRSQWSSLLAPCMVLSANAVPREVPVRLPAELAGAAARVEIHREDRTTDRYEVLLAGLPERGSAEVDGRRYVEKRIVFPDSLPLGYHDLCVAVGPPGGERSARMRLILTPDRAYLPERLQRGDRMAGVAVSLYGLRSARNWGCGDFGDLRVLTQWAGDDAGASFIALNPLHALHNRRPYNSSPYLPLSTFYQNVIYLEVEAIEDFQASAQVLRLWKRPEVQAEIEALRSSEFVEYERVHCLKLRFLKLMFASFLRARAKGSERWAAFEEFIEREGSLLDSFATYCALDEHVHRRNPDVWIWPDWPEPYRDPGSEAVRAFHDKHWRSVLFYKYVQWQLDLQLAAAQEHAKRKGLALGLYHDLALATDRCGADLWAYRRFYVSGCQVGSPPDDFSPKGQNWGFPPPNHQEHRDEGYHLFAESMRKNCRHGGALRIDHVMRFFRLYWIPDGLDASCGAYVKDHWEEMLRILALESVRNRVVVVGEDLGTVEPRIRETLARFGILSYRLLYFEKNQDGSFRSPGEYPAQSLVSITTHDLPTLAGFWSNEDIEARRRAGILPDEQSYRAQLEQRGREKQALLDLFFRHRLLPDSVPRSAASIPELTGELHNAAVGFLAQTPSMLMLLNQEDLTKETGQQNLPGTTSQHPNWSRKTKFAVEELRTGAQARDFTAMFRHWLERTGRLNR
ncbi:MAG: 4-alpha-glucanotransferase [Bryobacterales bacterium]|nr:4-alpha-glucanotransferase [Bryobacterales bacterium]